MPEPTPTEAPAPVADAPTPTTPVVTVAPLSRDIPLNQQTGKILKIMENLPEKKEDKKDEPSVSEDKSDDKGTDTGDIKPEVKTGEPEAPLESNFLEEDEDQPEVTPFEVKTWQEYVAKGVQPLTIIGKIGDELKEFKVFTEDQLPADFQYPLSSATYA